MKMDDDESVYTIERQSLLRDLKSTVEALLVTQVANVWSIYGGLNRLHTSVEKIFQHGCKDSIYANSYYKFIQGLEWLQPETSKHYFSVDCEYKPHLPVHLKNDKASTWLYRSIENHSLSQKLSWLLSDKSHLSECYHSYAFLCKEEYSEACLICLRAVERNQPSLMSEVNPRLFILKTDPAAMHKTHRRCSSFPDGHFKSILEDRKRSKTISCINDERKTSMIPTTVVESKKICCKLKAWRSMPNIQIDTTSTRRYSGTFLRSKTTPSTPVHSKKNKELSPSALKVDYDLLLDKKHKSNLKRTFFRKPRTQVKHVLIDNCDIIEHTPTLSSSQSSGAFPQEESGQYSESQAMSLSRAKSPIMAAYSPRAMMDFIPLSGEKDYKRQPKKSFIEDGGLSVLPMASGYFPKPAKGQSLESFLKSSQAARANAELDRENAHFSISEAIISAMEQIKCRRDERLNDERFDDSDPEICDLKQRIRLRRKAKLVKKYRRRFTEALMNDWKTDTTTSSSPYSSSSDTLSAGMSSDDVDDLSMDDLFPDNSARSMSMASLYSEAELMKRPRGAPDGASDVLSAEGVALSLISKFSEKQLPKASDLVWLVSEEEAPQALLPLPKSWPVSPDDVESTPTPLRGTQEWAPPRPQIIFTLHPPPSRKKLMESQNYRCAGCSMKVSIQYASRFRYCNYLGRYFCTGCHTNQLAMIPAKILQKWDFNRYPVSTFSYRLLEQMHADPLFRIFDLNKTIGKKSNNLLFCRKYRLGLHYLKDYICSCRFAVAIKERLETEIPNVLADPEVYSIEDLISIKSGEMKKQLLDLVDVCCRHTCECRLCLARGFICEVCKKDEVIFPWQMSKVRRCPKCLTCYHIACWDPEKQPCNKCVRINRRRESEASTSHD